jgi:hypothetical protein
MKTAEEAATAVREGWEGLLTKEEEEKRDPGRVSQAVYASGFTECVRKMVLDMLHRSEKPIPEPDGLARMQYGRDLESPTIRYLEDVGKQFGFEVGGQQETFSLRDNRGNIIIRGKTDCRIRFKRERRWRPVEVKAGKAVERIESFEQFFFYRWTKHMPYQMLVYLYGSGEPDGMFIIRRAGMPSFIPVSLSGHNWTMMERFLKYATEAQDSKKVYLELVKEKDQGYTEALPEVTTKAQLCEICDHKGINCPGAPPMDLDSLQVIEEGEVADAVATVMDEKVKDAARRLDRAKKLLKERVPDGMKSGVAGNWLIGGKWQERKDGRRWIRNYQPIKKREEEASGEPDKPDLKARP